MLRVKKGAKKVFTGHSGVESWYNSVAKGNKTVTGEGPFTISDIDRGPNRS